MFFFCFAFLYAEDNVYSLIRTSHELRLADTEISIPYTAITGKFPVNYSDEGENPPEIFFIAYFREGEKNRPITFVFPGGPGASCGPESICTIGPRRILTPAEGKSLLPPYRMIDNPETLLPWTDLVFVDPVGTGFSTRGEDSEAIHHLFSVEGDIAALGDFIRSFIAYFNRWNSPKYLSGISYGTTRCCGLADYLTFHDLSIHGIILLGAALDFSSLIGQHNRPLPDCLLIPTFAATAWYHGRLWPERSLIEVIDYARDFAFDTYIPAVLRPVRLQGEGQEIFYKEMARLLGLPLHVISRYQARFDEFLYTTEFFGQERKVLGGLDTRYVGDLGSIQRENNSDDPSYSDMQGLYCTFHDYLQNELGTGKPFDRYVAFSSEANTFWNYRTRDSVDWPELIQRVRRTLIRNPQMQIFIGSGYYDCRTPFAATEYCFGQLNLPSSYRNSLRFEYYEAGHGFVFDHESLKKLKTDLVSFYTKEVY